MPTDLFPDIKSCALSDVQDGSIVQYRNRLAIIPAKARAAGSLHRVLARRMDDGFVYLDIAATEFASVAFGNDLVLEIDVREPPKEAVPQRQSGMRLFVFEDGPRVVVRGDMETAVWHFLNLKTGILTGVPSHLDKMPFFERWRLGVKQADGSALWMIKETM